MAKNIQDDSQKIVAVTIETAKLTVDLVKAVIQDYIENKPEPTGRQSVAKLSKGNPDNLKNIKVSEQNMGDFKKVAAKYGIKYAVKKDTTDPEKPKYVILFQGKDLEQVNKAFKEYSFDKTATQQQPKRFSLKRLQELNREVKAQTQSQNKDKNRDRKRENMRGAR